MKFEKHIKVSTADSLAVLGCLEDHTGLAKSRIKDAMSKGAVWLKRGKATKRLRRVKTDLRPGDGLSIYYDEELLKIKPVNVECLYDYEEYSVWYKPPGILAQGTEWGDHLALLRIAQIKKSSDHEFFVIHRLDREASGLMLIAHSKRAAGLLSNLFSEHHIDKKYRIEVVGDLNKYVAENGNTINIALDDKESISQFTLIKFNDYTGTSTVEVNLITGRKHQIRRHFAEIGFPVVGDPRYGQGNKNSDGLKLKAIFLGFDCPVYNVRRNFELTTAKSPAVE